MLKLVPSLSIVDDDSFPYDFRHWDYPEELLRSSLYTAWWTEVEHDGTDYTLLMDYDGFIEWYNDNHDAWIEDSPELKDMTAEEYLPYHIGRTLCVVKEVSE